jgi:xylulokinase
MSIVAGVDSSTQSCTVSLHDSETGELLGVGQARHPPTTPPCSEQHPEDWWQAFGSALAGACADAGHPSSEIASISFAAQYHGLVALDAKNRVLRAAKLWNDTTSSAQARRLVGELGAAEWAHRVGSVPTAAFTITKLAWVRDHEPDVFREIAWLLVPHDWLTLQLCGERVTDRVDASGTGYFDASKDEWRTDVLDLVEPRADWSRLLPRVAGPSEMVGFAATERARELGLEPGTKVACGTGDQAAAALALGVNDGDIVVSLGTSGTVYGSTSTAVYDTSGFLNVTANARGGFQPIAVLLNAAKVTDTFCRLLGVGHDALSALALTADARVVDRPLLVAFLDGERSPNRPDARGILAGLSSATERESVALAAFEGVVLGLFTGFKALQGIGVDSGGRLILTGGASRSEAYRKIIARIFGKDVHAPEGDGGLDSARGAAIQAATVLQQRGIDEVAREWALPIVRVAEADCSFADRARILHEHYVRATQIRSLDGIWNTESASSAESI